MQTFKNNLVNALTVLSALLTSVLLLTGCQPQASVQEKTQHEKTQPQIKPQTQANIQPNIKDPVYKTTCVDADTSVDNDIAKEGIAWSLSTHQLQTILSMVEDMPYRDIYLANSITTCELEMNDINFRGSRCQVSLNAGSYGYAKCDDGKEYGFGCYKEQCVQYFPFPYVNPEDELLEDKSAKQEFTDITKLKYDALLDHPNKDVRVYCQHLDSRSSCFFEAVINDKYIKHDISKVESDNLFRVTDTPAKIEVAKTYPTEWIDITDDSATINIKTESYKSAKKQTSSTLLIIDFDTGMVER